MEAHLHTYSYCTDHLNTGFEEALFHSYSVSAFQCHLALCSQQTRSAIKIKVTLHSLGHCKHILLPWRCNFF